MKNLMKQIVAKVVSIVQAGDIMIKKRKRPNEKNSNLRPLYEYFFKHGSIEGWFTVHEFEKFKNCKLGLSSIQNRINNKSRNPLFETIEGCVLTPKLTGTNRDRLIKNSLFRKDAVQSRNNFEDWIYFNQLMPVGSLSEFVR